MGQSTDIPFTRTYFCFIIRIRGITLNGRRSDLYPPLVEMGGGYMSDYEMLSLVLMIGMLVVSIIALCLKNKA